jgi:mannose-6-phosphate isomerase-like protein (cupin superfamily)
MTKTRYADIPPYETKDGSQVRELMHPSRHGNIRQSLAEATISPGAATALHRHAATEEIYHVTAGTGVMILADETFPVTAGDTILIPPGTAHCVRNTGLELLRILCACTPPYSHNDTELV